METIRLGGRRSLFLVFFVSSFRFLAQPKRFLLVSSILWQIYLYTDLLHPVGWFRIRPKKDTCVSTGVSTGRPVQSNGARPGEDFGRCTMELFRLGDVGVGGQGEGTEPMGRRRRRRRWLKASSRVRCSVWFSLVGTTCVMGSDDRLQLVLLHLLCLAALSLLQGSPP